MILKFFKKIFEWLDQAPNTMDSWEEDFLSSATDAADLEDRMRRLEFHRRHQSRLI